MEHSTSKLALAASVVSLTYFVMVLYYMVSEFKMSPQAVWVYKKLEGYEHFFMMAQINMSFQLISLLLHIFGHFSSRYRRARDFVFANLAFPFSVSTMVSFWTFWFLVGKWRVYPQDSTVLYPLTITHGFHTMSPAANVVILFAMKHDYGTNPFMFTYGFTAVYFSTACLMYAITGSFKKAYIEKFTRTELTFYYCAFTVFTHFCYMCGCLINNRIFRREVLSDYRHRRSGGSPPQPRPPTNRPPRPGKKPDSKND